MKSILNSLLKVNHVKTVRNLFTTSKCDGYEGPGKTTVHLVSKTANTLLVRNCAQDGFMLSNEMKVVGPMAIFPKTVFYWNVGSAADINRESLSLFFVLDPKPDLVVVGLESSYNRVFTNNIRAMFQEEDIPVEILPVRSACAAYNIVCDDGRFVAGAFIPPKEAAPHKLVKAVQAAKDQLAWNRKQLPQ